MWGVARLGARASLFPSCYRASGFARPSLAIASSFDGRVITPARTYCQLEVAPDNQETKLTAIPSNFSQLRYDPPPQQRLWELLHMKDITTEELYEIIRQKKHLRYVQKEHFDLVMRHLYLDNMYSEIKVLMRYMQRYNFTMTPEYYQYLIVTCAKEGHIQRASSYIFNMKKAHPDFAVTEDMFGGHLVYYATRGLLGYCKYYFYGAMGRHGIKPTETSYHLVQDAYCSQGRSHEEFEQALQKEDWDNFLFADRDSLSHSV